MQMSDLFQELVTFNSWLFHMTQNLLEPFITVILCLLSVFVVLGNMLVVSAICHENQLHSVTNYLIASLAAADCLVGAIVMPFCIISEVIMGSWTFGPIWCDLYHSFDVLASTASIMNLCAISLDRYTAITNPIKYPRRMTPKRVALLIAFLWTCSSLISFPAILWWRAVSDSPLQRISATDQHQPAVAAAQQLYDIRLNRHNSTANEFQTIQRYEADDNLGSPLQTTMTSFNGAANDTNVIKSTRQHHQQQQQHHQQQKLLNSPLGFNSEVSFPNQQHQTSTPFLSSFSSSFSSSSASSSTSSSSSSSSSSLTSSQSTSSSSSSFKLNTDNNINATNYFQDNEQVKYRCVFTNDTYYLLFSSFVSFYGPLCVMLYAYFRIYKAAVQQTRFLKHGSKQVMIGKSKKSKRSKLNKPSQNEEQTSADYRAQIEYNSTDRSQCKSDEALQGHRLVLRAHRGGGGASIKATSGGLSTNETGSGQNRRPSFNSCRLASSQKPTKSTGVLHRGVKSQKFVKPPPSLLPLISMNSDTSTDSLINYPLAATSVVSTQAKTKLGPDFESKIECVINEEVNLDLDQTSLQRLKAGQKYPVSSAPKAKLSADANVVNGDSSESNLRAGTSGIANVIKVPVEKLPEEPSTPETSDDHLEGLIENKGNQTEQTAGLKKTFSFKKHTQGTSLNPAATSTTSNIVHNGLTLDLDQIGGVEPVDRVEPGTPKEQMEDGSGEGQSNYCSHDLDGSVDLTGMHYIDCSTVVSKELQCEDPVVVVATLDHLQDVEEGLCMENLDKSSANNRRKRSKESKALQQCANTSYQQQQQHHHHHHRHHHQHLNEPAADSCSNSFCEQPQDVSNNKEELTGGHKILSAQSQQNGSFPEPVGASSYETVLSNISGPSSQIAVGSGGVGSVGATVDLITTPLNVRVQNRSVGRKLTKLAKERKAAKTLGIVVGVFILCWLPFFVVNIIVALCGTSCIYKPHILMSIVTWLGWLNSAMNPVIYACWSRDFRRAFRRVLCAWVEFLCPYEGSNIARKLNLKKSSNYSPQEVYLNRALSSIKGNNNNNNLNYSHNNNTSNATMRSATNGARSFSANNNNSFAGCSSHQLANGAILGGAVECELESTLNRSTEGGVQVISSSAGLDLGPDQVERENNGAQSGLLMSSLEL